MKIINFYFLLSITFTLLIKSTKGYTIYGYDNIDFGDDSEIDSDMESDYEIEDEGRHYFIFISNPTGKGEDEEFKEHINFYIQEIHDLINLYRDDYKDPSVLEQMEKNYNSNNERHGIPIRNNIYADSPFVHFVFTLNYETCILAFLTRDLVEEIRYMPNILRITTNAYVNYGQGALNNGFTNNYGYNYVSKPEEEYDDSNVLDSMDSSKYIYYDESNNESKNNNDNTTTNSCINGDSCNTDNNTYVNSESASKSKLEPESYVNSNSDPNFMAFNKQNVISELSVNIGNSCWSEKLGYPCCKGCTVYETDSDGQWGIENNSWCGINTDQCK